MPWFPSALVSELPDRFDVGHQRDLPGPRWRRGCFGASNSAAAAGAVCTDSFRTFLWPTTVWA